MLQASLPQFWRVHPCQGGQPPRLGEIPTAKTVGNHVPRGGPGSPQWWGSQGRSSMIEVRDLTKRYGGGPAVGALSLYVRPGTATGFLGPNGCGKTTTTRPVPVLHPPQARRG